MGGGVSARAGERWIRRERKLTGRIGLETGPWNFPYMESNSTVHRFHRDYLGKCTWMVDQLTTPS